jgi:GAF domain-containing protein
VRVSVEQAHERWPGFARSARAAGVESYLSHPMIVEDEFAGSLNLYSEEPHGFGEFDVSVLRLYVSAACAAIADHRRYAQARDLADNLRNALDSRAVIDQARGMLMTRQGLTAEQALEVLKHESQHSNVKLRDVAIRLVDGTGRGGQ